MLFSFSFHRTFRCRCFVLLLFGGAIGSNFLVNPSTADGQTRGSGPIIEHPVPAQIPIRFALAQPGEVTLVIDDAQGKRVRNLIASTWFEAGEHTVMWDGLDESGMEPAEVIIKGNPHRGVHGIYQVRGKPVAEGDYVARGLVRDPLGLIYEFAPYSPGEPPWGGNAVGPYRMSPGGWLADHGIPAYILYIPPEHGFRQLGIPVPKDGQLMVVSPVAEDGHGVAYLDTQGNKLFGQRGVGGETFISGQLLASDRHEANPDVYAYVACARNSKAYLTVMHRAGKVREREKPLLETQHAYTGKAEKTVIGWGNPIRGLAVDRGLAVVGMHVNNKLLFIDVEGRKIIKEVNLPKPGGLAFTPKGELLAVSGDRLLRLELEWAGRGSSDVTIKKQQVLVDSGVLTDPQQLTLDDQSGNIFVSMWGDSNQIQVLNSQGKPLRRIGKPGPLGLGAYDPLHMNTPYGMTLTPDGRLWVAEFNRAPRRLSVWSQKGELLDAFYGASKYGGGARIDPLDATQFYLSDNNGPGNAGLRFKLDWKKGTATLKAVYARYDTETYLDFWRESAPQMPFRYQDFHYVTDTLNQNPVSGSHIAGLWRMDKDEIARPVSAVGNPIRWKALQTPAFRDRFDYDSEHYSVNSGYIFAWSDLNGNGKPEPDEVQFRQMGSATFAFTLQPDLTVIGQGTLEIPVKEVRSDGVPIYDLAAAKRLVQLPEGQKWTRGVSQTVRAPDDYLIVTGGPMRGFRDGKLMWTYPSRWPSLHASHFAPKPSEPGEMIGTTRLLGWPFQVKEGEAGAIWAVNGNKGNMYLMTSDGLFLGDLGVDKRLGTMLGHDEKTKTARRGLNAKGYGFSDEHFRPTLNPTPDGKIYLIAGKNYTGIFRVEGLDSVKRLGPIPVHVTPENRARMAAGEMVAGSLKSGAKPSLPVALKATALKVDGNLEDWKDAKWATIEPGVSAAATVAGDRLYVAYQTQEPELIQNIGNDPDRLFLSGGGLDLMLGLDSAAPSNRPEPIAGDLRLVVAQSKDGPVATLYEAIVPGTDPVKRSEFSSPDRSVYFDRVRQVSDQVELASQNGRFEFSLPLDELGLQPQVGQTVLADFGVLRGNGTSTHERVYWSNKGTAITSDVPSEAMLTPGSWGIFEFVNR